MSDPTVGELREVRAMLSERWLQAGHELAATGARFSSVDLWERVKHHDATRENRRLFFRSIHKALAPLVDAGLLETGMGVALEYGIAKRYYWRPK